MTRLILASLSALSGMLALVGLVTPMAQGSDASAALDRVLERSHVAETTDSSRLAGRELFHSVLATEAFVHAAEGPFDIYVYLAGDCQTTATEDEHSGSTRIAKAKTRTKSKKKGGKHAPVLVGRELAEDILAQATAGLSGLSGVLAASFPERGDQPRIVSGRRFPIVLCADDGGQAGAFDDLVSLLDHCDPGYTDFTRTNGSFWSSESRESPVVRDWEAQLVNLSHSSLVDIREDFLESGLGYFTIAHLVRRLIVNGSYGNPPPWFSDGLVDELDIQAHGKAWVGGDWYEEQTPGWYRAGWEGFLPTGKRPPPPVRGPPADLAVTVKKSGDSWAHRDNSPERHWNELAEDRSSEAPASFAFMAQNESFLPRDRALARCALHLMLELAPSEQGQPSLLALLDEPRHLDSSGMPDSEPLTKTFAKALGGVKGVRVYAEMTGAQLLEALGLPESADRLEHLGAGEVLQLSDHRDMARWLYQQYDFGRDQRVAIWNEILAIEYYRQLAQWERIGEVLDEGVGAALDAAKSYPRSSSARRKVAKEFRGRGAG